MRSKLAVVFAIVLAILPVGATPGVAERPVDGCPTGFNFGAMTAEERLQLPQLQAALADGVTTIEAVQAVDAFVDKNGNGVLCVQDIAQRSNAAPQSGSQYAVILGDDTAAGDP